MIKAQLFVPDPSNLGGRTSIKNQLKGHHVALTKVKPILNTLEPPRPHVNQNKQK